MTIPVSFRPLVSGPSVAALEIAGNMDAGTLSIPLTGYADDNTVHGRAMQAMLPTGSAWHGESVKALMRGIGVEMAFVERELKERAGIDNTLHGLNRVNWMNALGLIDQGNDADNDAAIDRKLADVGGLHAADMTRELQAAGFPLTVYPNRWTMTPDPETFGETYFGSATFSNIRRYHSRNLLELRYKIPSKTFGSSYFGSSTFGLSRADAGAEIVANSLDWTVDATLWVSMPDENERYRWHYGFIVSGDTIFDIKTISEDRRRELRRLILEIKPLGMWAFLIVNYE